MLIEDQLRERLKKVEALYFGATTAGERDAAEAAAALASSRLQALLEQAADAPDANVFIRENLARFTALAPRVEDLP